MSSTNAETLFASLVERNQDVIVPNYRVPPKMEHFAHLDKKGKEDPGRIFIVTCSDSRADPTLIFGLKAGEATVIRNAGGRVEDSTFRSLEVMGTLVKIGLVVVMHHTDCGGLFTTDQEVGERLSARAPDYAPLTQGKWFGTFGHLGLEESVRHDVQKIKEWPFLPQETPVLGYVLEVETGKLTAVAVS